MKLKVLILESDSNYLQRISSLLSTKYNDELDVYSFDDYTKALKSAKENEIDVFLASEDFDVSRKKIPGKCAFAYLAESPNEETIKDQKAIFKFVKINDLYESIKKVYSKYEYIPEPEVETKTVLFVSPSGGTGSSTAAASCAVHFAAAEKRTLYVNLEKLTSAKSFFSAESSVTVSDIASLVQNNDDDISSQLEEAAAEDETGIFVISAGEPNEILKLNVTDFAVVINALTALKQYEYIVIDGEFDLSEASLSFYRLADKIVFTSSGSEISNAKLLTAVKYISDHQPELSTKIAVLYSRFGETSTIPESDDLNNIGGIPNFDFADTKEIMTHISGMGVFDILAE